VRVVQLYPLQSGIFTVDAMEVMNKIEFSKSAINKKTEQEITEGVFENNDHASNTANTVTYENSISTEKINIRVRPYPDKNKPAAFNGATGNFSITARLEKNNLAKNEQGAFIITLKGKGNFTQLSAPAIQWPSGIEGFEPAVKDSLDKRQTPLKGGRTFRYSFISDKSGDYIIPSISFSFFDPDSNRYKTVSTQPTEIRINNEEKKDIPEKQHIPVAGKKSISPLWIFGGLLFLAILFIIIWPGKTSREKIKRDALVEKPETVISTEQLLQPAQFSLVADDGRFYTLLQKTIWDFLGTRLNLSGSKMNKDELYKAMKEKKWDEDQCRNILNILQQCEAAVFTKAELAHDKQELLDRAKIVLEQIRI
ncbi:MAG TPA: BatD family protein, partial [Chitinophagaceae bacterium]|nr:BatD family protein [Chitinophagaceae bacterium]